MASQYADANSAGGGIRTHTPLKTQVPKTCASTIPPLRPGPLYRHRAPIVPFRRARLLPLSTRLCLLMITCMAVPGMSQQPAVQWAAGLDPLVEVENTWLESLQLGSVRIGRCAATFVTATGLLATSYECARRNVRPAWRVEHVPLDDGFYAPDLMYERRVPDLFADQLVDVQAATGGAPADSVWQADGGLMVTEVRAFEDSSRLVAYTWRRYEDVRVVMMPERAVARFGGDEDAGTYPRYSLGFGFLRAYDGSGHPVLTESYLPLSGAGILSGEVLYSIGAQRNGPQIGMGAARGRPYNGTWASPFTTLFGLYDLHYSHGAGTAWELSEPWLAAGEALDLSAQLNVAATTPCAVSGAPLVNVDLEVLAISFGGVGSGEHARCIGAAGTGIFEVLRVRYEADALVAELEEEGLDEYAE